MTIELNHTIVYSRDKRESSDFLAGLSELPTPGAWGPFRTVGVANQVTLDYLDPQRDRSYLLIMHILTSHI